MASRQCSRRVWSSRQRCSAKIRFARCRRSGRLAAEDLGDGLGECIALELHRLRQRVAVKVWSSYQDHIVARTQYADPTPDTRRQHTRDAIRAAEERELAAQRHVNEHYMHRQGRPMVLGV